MVKQFRRSPECENMRLQRIGKSRKQNDQNCQFLLNLDSSSDPKPNFSRIDETGTCFVLFVIFGCLSYLQELVQKWKNLTICVAYPLSSDSNDSKIAALLGVRDADWEILEGSLEQKFDKEVKKLY